jgi:hypothetical protein
MAPCDLPEEPEEAAIAFQYALDARVGIERLTPTL